MPNPEVKPSSANGTAEGIRGRVGRRLSPFFFAITPSFYAVLSPLIPNTQPQIFAMITFPASSSRPCMNVLVSADPFADPGNLPDFPQMHSAVSSNSCATHHPPKETNPNVA